jgi:hypothetical protein
MNRRIPGGSIPEAGKDTISATAAAFTGQRIAGNARPRTVMRWKLDGEMVGQNKDIVLYANRTIITATEAINFLSADALRHPLSGRFEVPAGEDAPYYLEYR